MPSVTLLRGMSAVRIRGPGSVTTARSAQKLDLRYGGPAAGERSGDAAQVGIGVEISRTLCLNYRGALNRDAHRGKRKDGRTVHYRSIDGAVLAAVTRAV